MVNQAKIIAVCGKGGVGKTSISALMVKLLANGGSRRVLAIDADPATGLAMSLGVQVQKTVDDIRKDLITDIKSGAPASRDKAGMIKALDFEIFSALEQEKGFALLAIGRPEDEGCFCKVNSLLKEIIIDLAGKFDVVLIDGEAGIEQINRRVMKTVDRLLLVTDTSAKGVSVANTIASVARENKAVDYKTMGLVLNRVRNLSEVDGIGKRTSLDVYGWIGDDDLIRALDFEGKPLMDMPDISSTLGVISGILQKMQILI